jgi:hypothetical protein
MFYLIPHAMFNHWSGGGGWGPRLLLPVIPLLVLSSGYLIERMRIRALSRVILILLISFSLVIQMLGVSVNWSRHLQRIYDLSSSPIEYSYRIYYQWSDSAIIGQAKSLIQVINLIRNPETRSAIQMMIAEQRGDEIFDYQTQQVGILTPNVPDFWFVYLWFLGVPSIILVGAIVILGAITILFGMRLKRFTLIGDP